VKKKRREERKEKKKRERDDVTNKSLLKHGNIHRTIRCPERTSNLQEKMPYIPSFEKV
jgi:hypothetical protein